MLILFRRHNNMATAKSHRFDSRYMAANDSRPLNDTLLKLTSQSLKACLRPFLAEFNKNRSNE